MHDAIDAAQFWIGFRLVETQALSETELLLGLEAAPHMDPRCGRCHRPCGLIHDRSIRRVRERNLFDRQVWLEVPLRRVVCLRCGVSTEHVHWLPSRIRLTGRLIAHVEALLRLLPILPDPSVIDIEGERVLLMHGDTLCTDDVRYQAFRTQTRDAGWQRMFLGKPLSERQAFAAQARAESQRYTRSVEDAITDVNEEAVRAAIATHRVGKLIHGHTHRPARHRFQLDDSTAAERIVLGDWYEQGSAHRA